MTVLLPTHTEQRDALAERMFLSNLAALDLLAFLAGERLGWYAALHDRGPLTAGELAAAAGTDGRYTREWLEHQAAGGVLEVDDAAAPEAERRYGLPAGHAEALLDRRSLAYSAPLARLLPTLVGSLDAVLDAFRHGGGVPWDAYGADGRESQSDLNRPLFEQLLAPEWLPSIPDVHERLSRPGARVADVACGGGWAGIAIARQYPGAVVDGYDVDAASVELARANAEQAGVGDRVRFHVLDAAAGPAPAGAYDLVLVIEALHDMARPVEALATVRAMAGEDGVALVIDERTEEAFTAPAGEVERALYGFSLFVCLPTGRSETPSAGTGTVMRPATLRRYARDAGFERVDALPIEHEMFRVYRLG